MPSSYNKEKDFIFNQGSRNKMETKKQGEKKKPTTESEPPQLCRVYFQAYGNFIMAIGDEELGLYSRYGI